MIGMGEWSPTRPCHTTEHAGAHPAVRRVELAMSRELPMVVHRTLLAVHPKLELRREESRHASL